MSQPARILYREITDADIRKLLASANDSQTGGGARDLRFPYREFDDVMRHLLPRTKTANRRRGGVQVPVTVRVGQVKVANGPTVELSWEPPTDARKTEGRIPTVHDHLSLPESGRGRVFLLLIQELGGDVRAYYAYEDDLRGGKWNPETASAILDCADDPDRRGRTIVQGYIDLIEGRDYCHGVDPRA